MISSKEKYLKNNKYQADANDISNRYSLRNPFGFYFEYRKFREVIKLLNYTKLSLKNKKILDVGCHRGFQLNHLAFIKGTSKEIYGIDFIPSFIEDAKLINSSINFQEGDVYDLKFEDKYFDFISFIYVFNAIPMENRPLIAYNLSKKLKDNGYILLFEFSDNWLINLIRKIKGNPARHLNNKIVRNLFPDFDIIKSKNLICLASGRLCRSFPYWFVELMDYILPRDYYSALIKKKSIRT